MTPGSNGCITASPHKVVPDPTRTHHVLAVNPCPEQGVDETRYPFTVGHYVRWKPSADSVPGQMPAMVLRVDLYLSSLDMVGATKASSIGPFLIRCLRQSQQFQGGELVISELTATDPLPEDVPIAQLYLSHTIYAAKPKDAPANLLTIVFDEHEERHCIYWDGDIFGDFCVMGMMGSLIYSVPPDIGEE